MLQATSSLPMGPRERALKLGIDGVSDHELIALVLGTGGAGRDVFTVARSLEEDGLEALARNTAGMLGARTGVGPVKGLRLAAAFELGRRACRALDLDRKKLSTSHDVAAYARSRLSHLDHEEMWLLALDGQNGARAFRRIAQGGLHGCAVSGRDILRVALIEAASAMVLVHNHPSGDPTPSSEDIAMSRAVAEAGEIVGVALLDHVIIARNRHASLLDLGVL